MRYDDIRQAVLRHFIAQLDRFKDGINTAGPISTTQRAALDSTLIIASAEPEGWAGLVHPEGAAGLLRDFCVQNNIPIDGLTNDSRRWLLTGLHHAHKDYAAKALDYATEAESFDLNLLAQSSPGPAIPPASDTAPPADFQEVTAQYLTEATKTGGLAAKTLATKREALALLGEALEGKPVSAITKADARAVKEMLLRYPKNRNKLAQTRDKSLADVLAVPDLPPIAARTMNAYLGNMQTFFGWAVDQGHVTDNLFKGLRIKAARQSSVTQRAAFSDDQLRALFAAFTQNPPRGRIKPEQKWIALIGMFTGMRLNEIAQLNTGDLQHEEGLWSITVSLDGNNPNKRLKNQASHRRIPVHDKRRAAGLPAFVAERRAAGGERLFPTLPYCPKNGYGRNPGRWFNERLLPALGITDKGQVFHSLRHTMATKLARAGVSDTRVRAVLGHEQPGVTFSTYFHGFAPIQLKPDIDMFDF